MSLNGRVSSADGEISDPVVGGFARVLVMNGIANGTVFGFEDFLNFAQAVRDIVRCPANRSVFDEVAGLEECSKRITRYHTNRTRRTLN